MTGDHQRTPNITQPEKLLISCITFAPQLPAFFYKIRIQELLYWLFVELANRLDLHC